MAIRKIPKGIYINTLKEIRNKQKISDGKILDEVIEQAGQKISKLTAQEEKLVKASWNDFTSFWPPRLLTAYKNDKLICFFGAGLSIPSGLPTWNSLLTNYLKIDDKFTTDKDLESDPLTLAEIASNYIGSENLQKMLRDQFSGSDKSPSTNHYIAASLRLPVYITTNYDGLFENAWEKINPTTRLVVISNDIDLARDFQSAANTAQNSSVSYLFKIHGCCSRIDEQLILTRKDYRLHYRSNDKYFEQIKLFLKNYHTLFIGFSHKDIEVTRLVEDAIFTFEKERKETPLAEQPNFYSLQFDMRSHTPEIFAAKGIVALEPAVDLKSEDPRSNSMNNALAELFLADAFKLERSVSLEADLDRLKNNFETALQGGLSKIGSYARQAIESISGQGNTQWLKSLLKDLGDLANEGVYLCNENGENIDFELPPLRYKKSERPISADTLFNDRPYFRQAKTFRHPFVSDSFKSIYNGYSTFAVCLPVFENQIFRGLLFSACQIGNWQMPIDEATRIWSNKQNLSFILLDSNGNCLVPPNQEFGLTDEAGYSFDNLFLLSKKDKIIARLIENVLPINKDDDVINISSSVKYYSLITEILNTRWKIGITTPIILSNN